MTWLSALGAFFSELLNGLRTSRAAKAGAELPEGKHEVEAIDRDVDEIRRAIGDPPR